MQAGGGAVQSVDGASAGQAGLAGRVSGALAEWSQWHEVIEAALNFVRCRCLYVGAGVDMAAALPAVSASTVIELREELIRFVTVESSKAADRRSLPGTTEVLESCFGKLKGLGSVSH